MNEFDPNICLSELRSGDSDREIMALERFFSLPAVAVGESERQAVMTAAVEVLECSSNPYPIAERLLRFRERAVPAVAELLARDPSPEVTVLASLILVNNGSHLGVPALVAEIERGGDYLVMASFALANAGYADHVPALIERLRCWPGPSDREFPTDDDDAAMGLLEVLNKLQVQLPDEIRRKFADPQAHRFFRKVIERLLPP